MRSLYYAGTHVLVSILSENNANPNLALYYAEGHSYKLFQQGEESSDTLAAIGRPLEEEYVIMYLLAGLDADHNPLVTTITIRNEPMELHDVYSHLLTYEMRMAQQDGMFQGSLSSANLASCTYNNKGGGRG